MPLNPFHQVLRFNHMKTYIQEMDSLCTFRWLMTKAADNLALCGGPRTKSRPLLLTSDIGSIYELQGTSEPALHAYEQALRHNYQSIQALNAISNILRVKEDFPRAVEYLNTMLKIDQTNGEVWGSLGHCYLMMEDLQQAYQAYQQALFHLRDPKVGKSYRVHQFAADVV